MIVKIKRASEETYWYSLFTDCRFEVRTCSPIRSNYECISCLDLEIVRDRVKRLKSAQCWKLDYTYNSHNTELRDAALLSNNFSGYMIRIQDIYSNVDMRKDKIKKILC